MKNVNYIHTALTLIAIILFAGCTKFGTAVVEIKSASVESPNRLKVFAEITDDGGCDYFMEQGFCYSLFNNPSLSDVFSTQITVVDGYSTELVFCDSSATLPMSDTSYYVCAYVKNSAGLSYSPIVKVSTKVE